MIQFHIDHDFFLSRALYDMEGQWLGVVRAVAYDESIDALVYFVHKNGPIIKYDSRTTSLCDDYDNIASSEDDDKSSEDDDVPF